MVDPVKRPYRTSTRRGDAQAAILRAAAELFSEKGYHAVTIADIAAAARVARPTVYAAVGAKPEIFAAVIQHAITDSRGPGEPDTQPWFLDTLQQPTAAEVIAHQAHDVSTIGARVVGLYRAAEVAAMTDEGIAEIWQRVEAGRLRSAQVVAAELVGRPDVNPEHDADAIADLLYAVFSPAIYRTLVVERGWSAKRLEAWTTQVLHASLLRAADPQ